MPADPIAKNPGFKEAIVGRLHQPLPLRSALVVAMLGGWYFAGYDPMDARIARATADLKLDRKRLALAREVEALRAEDAVFAHRLPPRSDPNEFVQYVLDGVRAGPLKLASLSPEKPRAAGTYEIASVKLELEGHYPDVDAFLRWIEDNPRLLRVDAVRIDPDSKDPDTLRVNLSVLGLMGAEEKKPDKAKGKARPAEARPRPPAPKAAPKPNPKKAG